MARPPWPTRCCAYQAIQEVRLHDHPDFASTLIGAADSYQRLDMFEAAEKARTALHEPRKQPFGCGPHALLPACARRCWCGQSICCGSPLPFAFPRALSSPICALLGLSGLRARAQALVRAVAIQRRSLSATHRATITSLTRLAGVYGKLGRTAEEEATMVEALGGLASAQGTSIHSTGSEGSLSFTFLFSRLSD
jgi:hypothetical protein